MKKIIIFIFSLIVSFNTFAQNGLEGIIVEKFYVSDANDAAGSVGTLPTGSVTWRFYADLLPGYKLQAMYGVAAHELRFQSTAPFFNNEDRGAINPNWNFSQAGDNTVYLDSYFSVGGATNAAGGRLGVLKSEDPDLPAANLVNNDGLLLNFDPSIGIALTTRDGMTAGTVVTPTLVPATPAVWSSVDATSLSGSLFSTFNASVAALTGAQGPLASNRVLIAQITTTGVLSYKINLQIQAPDLSIQNFVAENPIGSEISIPGLSGTVGAPLSSEPTVNSSLNFTSVNSNSMVVNFPGGNGQKRLVVARAGSAVTSVPVDQATYSADANFGDGQQIGTGNFIVYAGTGTSFTLTGLNPATTYHFRVFQYNDDGNAGGENYRTSTFTSGSQATSALGTTYTFNQTGAGPFNFTTPSNWTPARNTPAADDILVFNNGTTNTIVNNIPSQTIARLLVQSNTSIILQAFGTNTLTINGNTSSSDDFRVDAGSSLSTPSVILDIANGATANIYGSLSFTGLANIKGNATNAVTFHTGSTATFAATFDGSPFGNAGQPANSVRFITGSNFIQNAGNNPFQRLAPSSVVQFNAGSNQTITNAGSLDLNGRTYANLTIGGNVTVNPIAVATIANLTIASGATVTISGTSVSGINLSGNLIQNSNNALSITLGSGNFVFTGGGTKAISGTGTGSVTFGGTLTVPSATTVNFNRNLGVNNLNCSGTFKFNAANLTLTIIGTYTGTGTISAFGSFDGNVVLNGTAPVGNLIMGDIKDFTYNRSAVTFTPTTPVRIFGTLLVQAGTIDANSNIIIRSNATRSGLVDHSGAGTLNGNIIVQRFTRAITGGRSMMLSNPTSAPLTVATHLGDDINIVGSPAGYEHSTDPTQQPTIFPTSWTYNPTLSAPKTGWVNASAQSMTSGLGIMTTVNPNITLDFTGGATSGLIPVSVSNAGSAWNLIGNPYPAPISWNAFSAANSSVITPTIVIWNSNVNNYATFNGIAWTNYPGGGSNDNISIGQGFFVGATSSGVVNFDNSMRTTATTTVFMNENNQNSYPTLRISARMNEKSDETALLLHADASNDKDKFDAGKLFAPEAKNFGIYTLLNNDALAINTLNSVDGETVIPVGFVSDAEGMVTFNFSDVNALNGAELYFEDMAANVSLNMNEVKSYSTIVKEGNAGSRFVIKANKSTVKVASTDMNVYQNNKNLIIEGSKVADIKSIEIIAGNAALVAAQNNTGRNNLMQISLPSISEGIYMVKMVYSNNQTETKKVFLKN